MKIAILDDYQNVASSLADWDSLAAEVVGFTKAFRDSGEAVRALTGFDVVVAMRERTPSPAGYESYPTIEHTWALILGAARNLPTEAASMRSGGWQVTVGEGRGRVSHSADGVVGRAPTLRT
jgi:phosphoglycerate dehydrogenase-like enzyme